MMYAAKLKLAVAIVVAVTLLFGIAMPVRQAMAEGVSPPPPPAGQSDPVRPAQVWGHAKAGLACSISAEKTTYRPGEPISVRFDLKNVSDKPQTVWHCGFWPNHRWIVQDAAGRDLKLTDSGRLCRERYDDPRREKNFPVVIQPGKLDASYYGPYDLRRHFEIPEGTTIHVQCVYAHSADGRRVEITSNTLTLTVERPLTAVNDGVKFEVIVTDRSGEQPETKEGERTKLDLALRITNQTGRALRFGRCRTTGVNMTSTSGELHGIKVRKALGRGGLREPTLADFPLLEPGQSLTLNAYWRDSALRLGETDDYSAGSWVYRGLEAGEYELKLFYIGMVRDIEVLGDDGAMMKIPKEEMWHGSVQSPPIKILLPEPPPDVRCGAIVDRFWEIPDKASGKRTKVDMALRIENRTDRALYFSRYDTIWPKLKSASGKTYDLTVRRLRTRQPTTADYPLVQPGDGVTFDIDAHLYWHDDELRLGGSDGFGGTWFFRGLEPGNYGLYFQFTMPKSRLARDIEVVGDDSARVKIPRDHVWTGDKAAVARITLVEPGGSKAVSTTDPTQAARSESVKTSDFLGPEDQWPQCRIVLEDIQPLFGGTAIYLDGSDPCVIRIVNRGQEKRFRIKLSPKETLALRKLCMESDLLTVAIKDRPGVPDEARPTIILINAKGQTFKLAKWANDEVPRFDKVYQALLELRKKTEDAKPEYDGKWQREWKPPNPV